VFALMLIGQHKSNRIKIKFSESRNFRLDNSQKVLNFSLFCGTSAYYYVLRMNLDDQVLSYCMPWVKYLLQLLHCVCCPSEANGEKVYRPSLLQ
jgi:hypothetical protein